MRREDLKLDNLFSEFHLAFAGSCIMLLIELLANLGVLGFCDRSGKVQGKEEEETNVELVKTDDIEESNEGKRKDLFNLKVGVNNSFSIENGSIVK